MQERRFWISVILIAAFIGLGGAVLATRPAHTAAALATTVQPVVARIDYADDSDLQQLVNQVDVWEVHKADRYVVAQLQPAEYLRLLTQGYHVVVDAAKTAELNRPRTALPGQIDGIPGYPCYRTVEETYASAQSIVTAHPSLAQWVDIGDSWEKVTPGGNAGYDLMVLVLTNQNRPGPKPKFFAMSAIHAREYTTAELETRFAEYLINNYGVDADATWLLDYNEVHLLLQANPDGRKMAETSLSWRKNTDNNYCANTNNRGADLNRNYPFYWNSCAPSDGCSSGNTCSETYRGPSAASEPETQAVINYVRSQYPDLRADDLSAAAPLTTTGLFMDIHSYSQLVLWPWGFTSNTAPNSTPLQTLGRKFAYFNSYTPQQSIGLYPTDGTTDDFAYGELGVPAYTIELGTAFFESCTSFENSTYPANFPALLYAAKAARRPYLAPAGPDTLNVSITPTTTVPGTPITLTATANDTRFNNSNGVEPTQAIAGAHYSIDTPPWVAGVITYPMTAADGTFNNPIESLQAAINLSSVGAGRHIIFAESQDANGNWGPPTAVFVWTETSSRISGYVRSASGGQAISGAAVRATANPTQTAETLSQLDGFYQLDVIPGTYQLTASKYGYWPTTIAGITATLNVTTAQNITLTPSASHSVSGLVRDQLTGQPLIASVIITGYPGGAITTTASGYYSVTLAEGITYTFQVNAIASGYLPQTRSVGPLTVDRTENFELAPDLASCTAPGYTFAGVRESFTLTAMPAGWNVINNVGTQGWAFNNPGARSNNTGGAGNFAIVDSDQIGNVSLDTELRTPVLNLTALDTVTLAFKTDFKYYAGSLPEIADVDVSVDGGLSWTNIFSRTADYGGPHTENIDLTALAAHQGDVRVRFHYYNAQREGWWQIDDVRLGQCLPPNLQRHDLYLPLIIK